MKILKTISIFSLLVFVSCAVEQEDLPIIQDQLFYNKMDEIFENPSTCALLEPKKINPFEVDFSTLISESGLKKNNGIQTNLFGSVPPEEIINADFNFQNLSNILIDKSLVLPRDEFLRLAYVVSNWSVIFWHVLKIRLKML